MIHETSDQNIFADQELSWVTDADIDTYFIKTNCPLQHFYNYDMSFPAISNKTIWKTSTWHVAWVSPLKAAITRPEDMPQHHQNSDIYKRNVGPGW